MQFEPTHLTAISGRRLQFVEWPRSEGIAESLCNLDVTPAVSKRASFGFDGLQQGSKPHSVNIGPETSFGLQELRDLPENPNGNLRRPRNTDTSERNKAETREMEGHPFLSPQFCATRWHGSNVLGKMNCARGLWLRSGKGTDRFEPLVQTFPTWVLCVCDVACQQACHICSHNINRTIA